MRLRRELLTARDSSIGSSGGTTLVKIRVHSRNSLYRLRSGSLDPEIKMRVVVTIVRCYYLLV